MAYILASITDDFRAYMPQFMGRLLGISAGVSTPGAWNPLIKGFKVGEGGWINPGTGAVRRPTTGSLRFAPPPGDNGLQDLDCIVDDGRPAMLKRYTSARNSWYYKALINSDFTYSATNTIRIRCFLDFSEFNVNSAPVPTAPNIWEIGIFAEHPLYTPSGPPTPAPLHPGQDQNHLLMIAYGTFPMEIKDNTKQIEHYVLLVD